MLLEHLQHTKAALQAYVNDLTNKCKNMTVCQDINSYSFWALINDFRELLQLLHETQIMSESSREHLNYVTQH